MSNKIRNPQPITVDKTELDVIYTSIKTATEFYQDSKTPAEGDAAELALKLYDTLYEYRDNLKERPHHTPAKYTLLEIFTDLKYGRHGESQNLLNGFIEQLKENKDKDIIWK